MTNRQSLDRPRNVACSCPNKFEVPLCVLLCEDRGILNLVDEEQDVFLLTRSKVEHDVRCDPKHVDRGCRACACCADDGHNASIFAKTSITTILSPWPPTRKTSTAVQANGNRSTELCLHILRLASA